MLRSPLRRAFAALSLALPACGDDDLDTATAATVATGDTTTGDATSTGEEPDPTTSGLGTTSVDPTTGREPTTGPPDETTSDATTVDPDTDGVNEGPVALVDRYITKAKLPLAVGPGGGLLANDYDDDGDPLVLISADPLTPGGAQVTALQDGSFTYLPPAGLWGVDSFAYKIWDGVDGFATAKVRVDVNPTSINLEYVAAGRGGFAIDGEGPGDGAGRSVAAVGDLDGDGLGEVAIGARNAAEDAGRIYVVFGTFVSDTVALGKLEDTERGFVITGEVAGDLAGTVIADAGDVNGDGRGDLVIGAPKAAPTGKASGRTYVVFGKSGPAPVFLEQVALGEGGFAIDGEAAQDFSGRSAAGAGDVDGDGLDDLVVGAYGADPNGAFSGKAYVVFGRFGGPPVLLADVAAGLGGGFAMHGEASLDFAGSAVAGAGDVDGDGLADLVVGAYGHDAAGDTAGRTYVVFGKADPAPVELAAVAAGAGGVALDGEGEFEKAGAAVGGAGDVDGDGFADILVGAPLADVGGEDSGRAYLVFGGPGLASKSLSQVVQGDGGFALGGQQLRDYAGTALDRAGDVNGDGYDDFIVGAYGSNPAGGDSGRAYVVFGGDDLHGGSLAAFALGDGGFSLDGEISDDYVGFAVACAGDVDGDGFADVVTGARGNDGKGEDAGRSYVVFGGDYSNLLPQSFGPGPDNIAGTAGGDVLAGGRGNDLFTTQGGPDVVHGGQGDDTIRLADVAFVRVDGGAGLDTLALTTAGTTLDLTTRSDLDLVDIEAIDLGDGGALVLGWRDLRALSSRTHRLTVAGAGTLEADLGGAGFLDAGVVGEFHEYTNGPFVLRVAETVQANVAL